MSRAPARFTQADVAKALKGFLAAGFEVGALEITVDGAIRIERQNERDKNSSSPFDEWKEKRHARPA